MHPPGTAPVQTRSWKTFRPTSSMKGTTTRGITEVPACGEPMQFSELHPRLQPFTFPRFRVGSCGRSPRLPAGSALAYVPSVRARGRAVRQSPEAAQAPPQTVRLDSRKCGRLKCLQANRHGFVNRRSPVRIRSVAVFGTPCIASTSKRLPQQRKPSKRASKRQNVPPLCAPKCAREASNLRGECQVVLVFWGISAARGGMRTDDQRSSKRRSSVAVTS